MAQPSRKRPKNLAGTFLYLLHYMGRHKFLLAIVAVLVSVSALANLLGTYMLRPLINRYIVPGDLHGLLLGVLVTAGTSAALCPPMATPRPWCGPPRRLSMISEKTWFTPWRGFPCPILTVTPTVIP